MLPKCTRTCLWPSRNRIWRSRGNFCSLVPIKSGGEGEEGNPPASFLQRGTVVSGVSCAETGTGKCSFQGCVPTRTSGLQGCWEDAIPLRRACQDGRFHSCRQQKVASVLAGRAQAAAEPTCLMPPSPGDTWSPEPPLSSWLGCLLLPEFRPRGLSLSVRTLLGPRHRHRESKLYHCLLSCYISTRIVPRWGRLWSYYSIAL